MTEARATSAVWWHTQQGPLVGLIPATRLDDANVDPNRWYVAVLAPTCPNPQAEVARHWRLAQFSRKRNYIAGNVKFQKVLNRYGGPARRATTGVALPDRERSTWIERLLLAVFGAIVRFFKSD